MSTKFTYTGRESIDLLKEHFPNDWERMIRENAALLERWHLRWNLPTIEDSYKRYMTMSGSAASSIQMLSSLQWIKDGKNEFITSSHSRIRQIISLQDSLSQQQSALEKSTTQNESDRKILRKYYQEKRNELSEELDQLTKSIKVVEPYVLIIQGNLFNETERK